MKMTTHRMIAIFLISMIFSQGLLADTEGQDNAVTVDEIQKESSELMATIGDYTSEKREVLIQKSREILEKIDQRIDQMQVELSDHWDQMDEAARIQAQDTLQKLREERASAAKRLESLQSSAANSWEHMKKGFVDAFRDLSDAWEKSEQEFKDEGS